MGKIIAFANMKGGVGKTMICATFASYLCEQNRPVSVIDADIQQSLLRHRKRDMESDPNAVAPYQILNLPNREVGVVKEIMGKLQGVSGYVLIDCPGNFEAPMLRPIFEGVTHVVVPFSYDSDSVDGTLLFVRGLKKLSPNVKVIFVPNRIKTGVGKKAELEQRKKTIDVLGEYGKVVARIKDGVAVQRYSTIYQMDSYIKNAVLHPFEGILNEIDK